MRCFDGSEQQRRDPHTSRAQRARGRCPFVHLFTSSGVYLPSLGGVTLVKHAKFEVIAKLIWCTRVGLRRARRATNFHRRTAACCKIVPGMPPAIYRRLRDVLQPCSLPLGKLITFRLGSKIAAVGGLGVAHRAGTAARSLHVPRLIMALLVEVVVKPPARTTGPRCRGGRPVFACLIDRRLRLCAHVRTQHLFVVVRR